MLLSIAGCSKSTEVEDPTPVPVDTTSLPIELDRQFMWLSDLRPSDTIKILSGNGGYRVYQPKQIGVKDGVVRHLIDNDQKTLVFNVIDDSLIVVTRTRPASACMLLMDSKGRKRVLFVSSHEVDDFLIEMDGKVSEGIMLAHYPDLWYID